MPIYVFQCPICLSTKDVLQKFTDAAPTCERRKFHECTNTEMVRIPAVSACHMKGFSSANGYTSARTIQGPSFGSVKTSVRGNFEGFSDRVVPD